ncbi:MAG TPA: type II CRISPR RNA-guided endonuclease Cas9 [Phycisphaerae bacterium]|nr:type II CRISPR RNA-guided endonuclease Cas9 [Phycisphaerae bacterium]
MPVLLGLDIGSNSVGSAWTDTEKREIHLAVSVFPAGVDEQENKRGAPKNQDRRQKRSQRRSLARRAERKHRVRQLLTQHGLLPVQPEELGGLFNRNPWELRRRGLTEPLSRHEFGRVLVHLGQRRGALGVTTDPEDPDEGKVKDGIDRLDVLMEERNARTVGQLMADLMDERSQKIDPGPDTVCSRRTVQRRRNRTDHTKKGPIRNRQYRMPESDQLYADRKRIREEFDILWDRQKSFGGELAALLTDDLKRRLDDPRQDDTWRHRGLLFGQRHTYWDTRTLGRCDLEPTDRCAPRADRHASYFRVVETVNNIRIETRGEPQRPLTPDERDKLIRFLRAPLGQRKQKGKLVPKESASVTDIKRALGINPRDKSVKLNIETDKDREINTDWFHREIVHGAFTEHRWKAMDERQQESVNRAILKFDPDLDEDGNKLRAGAFQWWSLDEQAADRLVEAWKRRPKLEKRLNLSRRAILNVLPYMEKFDTHNERWPTQIEARKAHAKVLQERFEQSGECAYELAARRYATGALGLTAADRYYMRQQKHDIAPGIPALPPAPMLSNPVVRKAIHEVRRHLIAWIHKFGRKPDGIVIEFARGVKDTAKRRNAQLAANREREKERKQIEEDLRAWGIPESNWDRAVLRVRLCREQNGVCPFSLTGPNANRTISERMAAERADVEVEHIIPQRLTGRTMAFNNLVLCFREANRGKGMRTPLDWLGPDGVKAMLQRLENAPIKDNGIKWQRLQAPTPDEGDFRNSQLTDTAYTARQVAAYLADGLYDGQGLPERGGERKIFTTKGEFTARLRADWGLHESTVDRTHGLEAPPSPEELRADPHLEQASRRARKQPKDRSDHRHHAVDALVTACIGPELLTQVGRMARDDREYRERTGFWPRRQALPQPAPWLSIQDFHQALLAAYENVIVSHRPVKRRLVGAFHEDTHYGPVIGPLPGHRTEDIDTLFTNRISADRLTPNHLRVPEGWDALSAKLDDPKIAEGEKRAIRRQLAAMKDPKPGKSGIVRDRALRDRLRKCLRADAVNADDFKAADIKKLVAERRLTQASAVPIKGVVLLRTNTDPVILPRKRWDAVTSKMVVDDDPRTARVYISGKNHHIEIREDTKTVRWSGRIVTTLEAARRVRIGKGDAVNRCDIDGRRFVMSLAEGEMIHARRKDRPEEPPNYFVVCKLDKPATGQPRIHFAPHWDARKAPPSGKKKRTLQHQDRWDVTPADLQNCGPMPGEPPYKVRVTPLGEVIPLSDD